VAPEDRGHPTVADAQLSVCALTGYKVQGLPGQGGAFLSASWQHSEQPPQQLPGRWASACLAGSPGRVWAGVATGSNGSSWL